MAARMYRGLGGTHGWYRHGSSPQWVTSRHGRVAAR